MESLESLLRSAQERDSLSEDALASQIVLEGRYALKNRIGRGGMGSVWEADDRTLGRVVAVKFMTGIHPDDAGARRRFEDEARVIAKLRSSYVVQVHDYGVAEGVPFMVMERLVGEDIRKVLRRERRFSIEAVEKISLDVGHALSVVHAAGIVHGDLKPSNLFMARHDDTQTVKLIDFGIATILADNATTPQGSAFGTPFYMSPEQILCERKLDPRTDLWSLGAILYRALTGARPFEGDFYEAAERMTRERPRLPSLVAPDLGTAFDTFFATALAPRPEQRFRDASALMEAFRAIKACARANDDGRPTPVYSLPAPGFESPTPHVGMPPLKQLIMRPEAGLRSTGLRLRAPAIPRLAPPPPPTPRAAADPSDSREPSSIHSVLTPSFGNAIGRPTAMTRSWSMLIAATVASGVVGLGLALAERKNGTTDSSSSALALAAAIETSGASALPPVDSSPTKSAEAQPASEPVQNPKLQSDQVAVAALARLREGIKPCVENLLRGLPGTSPVVPSDTTTLKSGPYASLRRDWNALIFRCAHFEIEGPMPFAIQWQADPQLGRATAVVWSSFNGDGFPESAYAFTVAYRARTVAVGDIEPVDASRPMVQPPPPPGRQSVRRPTVPVPPRAAPK